MKNQNYQTRSLKTDKKKKICDETIRENAQTKVKIESP